MGETTTLQVKEGGGPEIYVAKPEGDGPWPAVIVLAEIYNANQWVREVADGYAEAGYLAIAPDLYWRSKPGAYFEYTPEGQAEGRELGFNMDLDAFSRDMAEYIEQIRGWSDCTGKVGTVGFCLGGKLVYLAGTRTDVDAGVAYYAVQLQDFLGEADNLKRPLMMHFASLDAHVPMDVYEQVKSRLQPIPDVQVFLYEGADHGFNRHGYPPFHEEAAKLARQRSLEFLAANLT